MAWQVDVPKNDDAYFQRMSKAVFQAGLNWKMIDNKWSNFMKAFANFSIEKVAKFTEDDFNSLMSNPGIVRNQRKIRATIFNAQEALRLKKEYGSFERYIKSFHGANDGVINDLSERFHQLGPSSSRTFVWMVGVKLTPNVQERIWIENYHKKHKDEK